MFKIRQNLSGRLRNVLRNAGLKKDSKTMELLGCDMAFFKNYIESKFVDGMSWDNYGEKGWHIDHIRPCVAFDLMKKEERDECFHYTSLQPLWWYDNLHKQTSYDGFFQEGGGNDSV